MNISEADFKTISILLIEGLEHKIQKEITDISNWAYVMTVASGKIHKANMTRADIIRKEQFFRASKTTAYKRLYTTGEITAFLNKFTELGKLKKFLESTAKILTALEEAKKVIGGLKTSVKLFKLGTKMSLSTEQKLQNNKTVEDIQRDMEESAKKFAALMEALSALNTLSPPGFREYFEYGVGIFKGSQRLVTITKEYTQRLEAASREAESWFGKVLKNNNSFLSLDYAFGLMAKRH